MRETVVAKLNKQFEDLRKNHTNAFLRLVFGQVQNYTI